MRVGSAGADHQQGVCHGSTGVAGPGIVHSTPDGALPDRARPGIVDRAAGFARAWRWLRSSRSR